MRVLFFGRLRDAAGAAELAAPAELTSLAQLRAWLAREHGGLALDGVGVRVAVDGTIVSGDASLSGAREVAFMPPMSGG